MLLFLGTGVGLHSVLVQTALIHDAEATVVVVAGMNALHAFWQKWNHIAVAAHVVVVADLAVLALAVGNQVLNAEWAIALCGGAVDDQEFH